MRTVCFIQARLGSTRLPGKILMDLCGKPMLQHVVDRAKQIQGVDEVIVLTHWGDDAKVGPAVSVPVWAYPIPQNDVLTRFMWAALEAHADWIVRITGDCPLLNPAVGALVLQAAQGNGIYATNDTTRSGYPDGWDVQAFPVKWLMDASLAATDAYDREHVCPWMDRKGGVLVYAPPSVLGKMSVDTDLDLDRVRAILQQEQTR